jgi:hypothetical protein
MGILVTAARSAAAPPAPLPSGDPNTCRFIGFRLPPIGATQVAVRVTLTQLYRTTGTDACPARSPTSRDLSQLNGQRMWAGRPQSAPETVGADPNRFVAAPLQTAPYFASWATEVATLGDGAVYAYGPAVLPCSTYAVQLVDVTCPDLNLESCYSTPLTVVTTQWGDVIPDTTSGRPTFRDIGAVVNKYKTLLPPTKVQAMLRSNTPPVFDTVNFIDISTCVDAFKSKPYAQPGPDPCIFSPTASCDDGVYCNGPETCVGAVCTTGPLPCGAGATCDELNDVCIVEPGACVVDAHCDDAQYCNGPERCAAGACIPGSPPCTVGQRCIELEDRCEAITVGSWVPPIGIPVPPFGIYETVDDLYGSAGYYTHYVDNSAACDDGNNAGRGSAAAPRCTIPTSLAAGSVVIVRGGPYTYGNIDWTWTMAGTGSRPVLIRGPSVSAMPVIRDKKLVLRDCSYLIIENIHFDRCRVSSGGTNTGIAFRHNELRGRDGSNGMEATGQDWVIFDNHIHDAGTWDPPDDRHGITVGSGSQRVWILDNHMHGNSGDSIQFCHGCSTSPPRFVYVGGNLLHEDIENGVDIKYASDVVISQNTLFGYRPTDAGSTSSDGSAMVLGSDGGPDRVWALFNDISDSANGIRNESTGNAWIVGNRIYNVDGFALGLEKESQNLYFLFNTVYDADVGVDQFWRPNFTLYIHNNIFASLHGTRHNNHINIELDEVAQRSSMSHNVFWQNGGQVLISWGQAYDPYIVNSQTALNFFPGGTGNRLGDPQFTNAPAADFHLQPGSTAVDAGSLPLSDFVATFCALYGASFADCPADLAVDFDRLPRPYGANWDAGAHERPAP